jgi:salicylate biosynthesis isochorismate synthase
VVGPRRTGSRADPRGLVDQGRRGAATFLGATPERLLYKRGLQFFTEALAGTFRRSQSDFAAELLRSPKEHEEHQPVLDAILERLAPHAEQLEYRPNPELRELPSLLHLRTPIAGRLRAPKHILELVADLHPTPAVGGVPTTQALQWIAEHERHERGWYAGPIGWFDAAGDGEFMVALRSGIVEGNTVTAFAGAGIVQGSDPESEFAETELKFTALLDALRH